MDWKHTKHQNDRGNCNDEENWIDWNMVMTKEVFIGKLQIFNIKIKLEKNSACKYVTMSETALHHNALKLNLRTWHGCLHDHLSQPAIFSASFGSIVALLTKINKY